MYIVYFTTFMRDGRLHFGNDLYGRDAVRSSRRSSTARSQRSPRCRRCDCFESWPKTEVDGGGGVPADPAGHPVANGKYPHRTSSATNNTAFTVTVVKSSRPGMLHQRRRQPMTVAATRTTASKDERDRRPRQHAQHRRHAVENLSGTTFRRAIGHGDEPEAEPRGDGRKRDRGRDGVAPAWSVPPTGGCELTNRVRRRTSQTTAATTGHASSASSGIATMYDSASFRKCGSSYQARRSNADGDPRSEERLRAEEVRDLAISCSHGRDVSSVHTPPQRGRDRNVRVRRRRPVQQPVSCRPRRARRAAGR